MRPKLVVDGLDDMDRRLDSVSVAASHERRLVETLMRHAKPIADRARELVNVETGRLRDGIVVSENAVDAEPSEPGAATVFVGPAEDIYYADELEFGDPGGVRANGSTYLGTYPHPYMRPAWDMEAEGALKGIAADLGADLQQAAKG